ncbi:hypothetical protein ACFP1I_14900 [Dyadobacter subterraneus]|uniref:Uncharacterized protein n=1 Tax=Dyadobacter subterraneus TaxID=2773304 RepID=A0ABR9WBY8_9BACT|nr:hypothetical protein [Dyadobacter subterraneus]MBE9462947.1 hypothetical protein [Dyadobacter subterraneus]
MKTSIVAAFLLFCSSCSFAQVYVAGVNINEIDSLKVCLVNISTFRSFAAPDEVSLDYGQPEKRDMNRITNKSNGQKMKFYSIGHVLNFMENNGWVHYNSESLLIGIESEHFFYFRRK